MQKKTTKKQKAYERRLHCIFLGILQSRIWNKYSSPDCKFTILSLGNFTKRELKLMLL